MKSYSMGRYIFSTKRLVPDPIVVNDPRYDVAVQVLQGCDTLQLANDFSEPKNFQTAEKFIGRELEGKSFDAREITK